MRVRVTAVRVLLFRWWAHPPRPRDVATTIRLASARAARRRDRAGFSGRSTQAFTILRVKAPAPPSFPGSVSASARRDTVRVPTLVDPPLRSSEQPGHSRHTSRPPPNSRISRSFPCSCRSTTPTSAGCGQRSNRCSTSSTRTGSSASRTIVPSDPRVGEVLREIQSTRRRVSRSTSARSTVTSRPRPTARSRSRQASSSSCWIMTMCCRGMRWRPWCTS